MRILRGTTPPPVTRLEIAVLVSGITSMGLEILAGRIVAPEFGSSIYTWGSIIGVFLAALSLGYYQGGKRANTEATLAHITRILFAATVLVAFVIIGGDFVLTASLGLPLPPRLSPLVPVTILFGPPVYLLGFISPFAAELSLKQSTGEASGHVFALGTVGSIIGAFGTTFVLIPFLSIELIGLVFGGLLITAAIGISLPNLSRTAMVRVLLVSVILVGAVAGSSYGISVRGDVVYRTQTPYQQLKVVDRGDIRTLYLDGQPHSAMDLDDPNRHVFDYTRYFHLPLLMSDDVDRVLFVGGGGFTGPKIFAAKYNMTVDVVEIDPVVIRTAKEYFRVEPSDELRIHNQDGRQFLQETNTTYDLIILDAYKKDKVPFQLTTVEFMRLASRRLDDDGILYANVISAPGGPGSEFYRAEYKTMAAVYPQVYSFPTSEQAFVQNIELIATKSPRRITQADLEARNRQRDIGIDLGRAITFYRTDVTTSDVPVLRDDKAPVERLLDPMVGRKYVIEHNRTRDADTRADDRGPSVRDLQRVPRNDPSARSPSSVRRIRVAPG